MLHILRNKKTAKKVWIFLAIIIIPAFTLWGFGSSGRDKRDSAPVGKIFGRTISASDFNKSLAATRTAAIMQFGDNLPKVEKYLNLESQAWERLVLLEEAKRRRVNVTDREVTEVIEKTPYFQKDSSFDNKTYVEVLRYAFRLQPRAFEEQLRQNLILGKLYKQVTDGVQVDETKIRQEWLHKNKELSIEYIAALYEELAGKIKPAEKDVAEYYEKNKESFREPDSINLEYIAADSEEQSDKIQELIEKKLSLGEISLQLSLSVLETGLFNRFTPPPELKLSRETLNTIIKLNGDPAPVAQAGQSYYAFALKEKREGLVPELSKVKDRIRETLTVRESRKMAQEEIEQCLQMLKNNEPLKKAARACKLKYGETKFFKSSDQVEGLGPGRIFWEKADKLEQGKTSEAFSDSKGSYIIKLKESKPVDEGLFKKEKSALGEQMLAQEKNKVFSNFIEETKKKAQ